MKEWKFSPYIRPTMASWVVSVHPDPGNAKLERSVLCVASCSTCRHGVTTASDFARPASPARATVSICIFFVRVAWNVSFLEPDLKTSLRRCLTFAVPEKIVELAERSGADFSSANSASLDHAIGSVWGNLPQADREDSIDGSSSALRSKDRGDDTLNCPRQENLPSESVSALSRLRSASGMEGFRFLRLYSSCYSSKPSSTENTWSFRHLDLAHALPGHYCRFSYQQLAPRRDTRRPYLPSGMMPVPMGLSATRVASTARSEFVEQSSRPTLSFLGSWTKSNKCSFSSRRS